MARVQKTFQILLFCFFISFAACRLSDTSSGVRDLNEDNWREILDGEWMVEFFAPWCPACTALQPAWKDLATKSHRSNLLMRTAAVDVTQSPGLSGRFVVTALPTIFHVKDGVFRQYKGPRDADSMLEYVQNERWRKVDAVPGWKSPDSLQMTLVANFFKLSQILRSVHTSLMETYGLPTWGSYLIFAVATIFIGALLGLILVCVIDLLYPPKKSLKVSVSKSEIDRLAKGDQDGKEKSDDDNDLINEDIVDDATPDSDAEKNSPSDSSDDEPSSKKEAEAAGDKQPAADADKPAEVRKRRPRKAN